MARLDLVFIDTSELHPFTVMDVLLTMSEELLFTSEWVGVRAINRTARLVGTNAWVIDCDVEVVGYDALYLRASEARRHRGRGAQK